MSNRLYYFFLSLLLCAGLLTRLYRLGSVPQSLYWDEAAIAIEAKSIAYIGSDLHSLSPWKSLYPSYGDYKLPGYILASVPFMRLALPVATAVRLPSVAAGIASIALSTLIAGELFKNQRQVRQIQLATAMVITFSPWSIMFSRTAFEGHIAQALIATSVWLTCKSMQRPYLLLISTLIGCAAFFTYYSARFVFPMVMIATLAYQYRAALLTGSRHRFLAKKYVLVFVFASVSIALFAFANKMMHSSTFFRESELIRLGTDSVLQTDSFVRQQNELRELSDGTPLDRLLTHRTFLQLRALAENYADHVSLSYIFLTGDDNFRHSTKMNGLFLICFLPAFVFGIVKLSKGRLPVLLYLVAWWMIALLPASVPQTTPHALRSLNALLPLSILLGYGLQQLVSLLLAHSRKWAVVYASWCLFALASFLHTYFIIYPVVSASAWQAGMAETARQLTPYLNQRDTHILSLMPDQFFYQWFLLYSGQSPDEWKNQPTKGFRYARYGNVEFDSSQSDIFLLSESTVILVGTKETIENAVIRSKRTITTLQQTYHGYPNTSYYVAVTAK